jgi:hypothetical protein
MPVVYFKVQRSHSGFIEFWQEKTTWFPLRKGTSIHTRGFSWWKKNIRKALYSKNSLIQKINAKGTL